MYVNKVVIVELSVVLPYPSPRRLSNIKGGVCVCVCVCACVYNIINVRAVEFCLRSPNLGM